MMGGGMPGMPPGMPPYHEEQYEAQAYYGGYAPPAMNGGYGYGYGYGGGAYPTMMMGMPPGMQQQGNNPAMAPTPMNCPACMVDSLIGGGVHQGVAGIQDPMMMGMYGVAAMDPNGNGMHGPDAIDPVAAYVLQQQMTQQQGGGGGGASGPADGYVFR